MVEESTGFDSAFEPPFPWCLSEISDPRKLRSLTRRAYLDTGSDGTIVPEEIGEALKLEAFPSSRATVLGIGGKPEQRILFAAVFNVGGLDVRSVIDIRDDVEIVLLGRDILQHTTLSLSWKESDVTVKDP